MPIQIRRASLADLRTVAEVFDAYRQFYGPPADFPPAETFLCDRLTKDDSVIFLANDPASGSFGTAPLGSINDPVLYPRRKLGSPRRFS